MSILPKKEKQELLVQAIQECIKLIPILFNLVIFFIVLTVGTCLGWDPIFIGIVTKLVTTGNIKLPNKDSSHKN